MWVARVHAGPAMTDDQEVADGPSPGTDAATPVGGDRPRRAALDAVAVNRVWRLHDAALECQRHTRKRFAGRAARRALREALLAETDALAELGFSTFEEFVTVHPYGSSRVGAPPVAPEPQAPAPGPGSEPEPAAAAESAAAPAAAPAADTAAPVGAPDELEFVRARVSDLEMLLDARAAELERVLAEMAALEEELRVRTRERDDARDALHLLEANTVAREKLDQLEATVIALEESIRLRTRERDDARAALEHERTELAPTREGLAQLDATAARLRAELVTTEEELRALREVAHADAERLLHHTVGETARMREDAEETAHDIVERARAEADLIRREAHVTAHGIREIAREDAKQLRATVEILGTRTDLPDRIARLERALTRHRKFVERQGTKKRGK